MQSKNWTYQATVDRAINNIVSNLKGVEDVYALALASYALQLAEHPSRKEVLESFISKSIAKGNHRTVCMVARIINYISHPQMDRSGGANLRPLKTHPGSSRKP